MSPREFDAIVIGGGHNGLVTAGYLQRAGVKTLVLEARSMVGGSCVTEEIFPGFKMSTTSYVCSLLRPKIIRDLELQRYGLEFIQRDPSSFTPFPDGSHLTFWADQAKTIAEIGKFSAKDAAAYPKYEALLSELADFVEPLLMMTPPDPLSNWPGELWQMAKLGLKARSLGPQLYDKIRMLSQSCGDFLDRWFESDALKSTLATDGIIGAFASPYTPGTAYVLLHHVMGETFGRKGVWAYVRGGMGGITQAMAKSFLAHGGTIRTASPVAKIIMKNGRATGVRLKSGEDIYGRRIISNVDPRKTFVDLMDAQDLDGEFLERVKMIRYGSATFKLNLALSGLPKFSALSHSTSDRVPPELHGTIHISPSMDYIVRAYDDARQGRPSSAPVLECTMASVLDPSLAPEGQHVMSIFVQYAPYQLKDGPWVPALKEAFSKTCIDLVETYAPGFKNLVLHQHALSPLDLEAEYGLAGGNIFQGEMSLDQLFFMRPLPECARYRTPIKNLWMCGASTHPGGGVMGASGHNAAREILRELS